MSKQPSTSGRACRLSGVARAAVLAGLAVVAGVLPACRGDRSDKPPRLFFPDMDHQPKWKAQDESPFYADERTQRPTVDGTVPFGRTSHDPAVIQSADWAGWLAEERGAMLAEDDAIYRGVRTVSDPTGVSEPSEVYLDNIPVAVTNEMIQRGQERFQIFCTPCHGYTGTGDGSVGAMWSYTPANLQNELYSDRAQRQGKDGYLFHVVRNGVVNAQGVQAMRGYSEKLSVMDSWAVVAYLRALQASQNAEEGDVPPEFRSVASRSPGGDTSPTPAENNNSDSAAEQNDNASDAAAAGGEQ